MGAAWVWAALSVAAVAVSFFAAFGVMVGIGAIGLRIPDVRGVRAELGVLLGLFAAFAAAGVLGSARLAFGRWLPMVWSHAVVPAIGVAVAIAVELVLHEWGDARWGYYDWDVVGWTGGLSFALATLAVATLAVGVAPRGGALPPLLCQVVAAAVVGLIALSNVPGLRDWIEAESWPLAILIGLSGAYTLAAIAIGFRRWRPGQRR